jgi:hypothetical protein
LLRTPNLLLVHGGRVPALSEARQQDAIRLCATVSTRNGRLSENCSPGQLTHYLTELLLHTLLACDPAFVASSHAEVLHGGARHLLTNHLLL